MIISKPKTGTLFSIFIFVSIAFSLFIYGLVAIQETNDRIWWLVLIYTSGPIGLVVLIKVLFGLKLIIISKEKFEIRFPFKFIRVKFDGKDLVGWEYSAPFEDLDVQKGVEHKVISWEDVSDEEGTGIVHIAPGCGREDYGLSKKYGLSVIKTLDEAGNYIAGFGELTGKNVSEVNEEMFAYLKEKKYPLSEAKDNSSLSYLLAM